MFSQVFERNAKPVIDGLSSFLRGASGQALEIGSGTGQHICAFAAAFPDLYWIASDPDPIHRRSIEAWRALHNAQTAPALNLDAASDWAPQLASHKPLRLVLSLNVIHIAPIEVAEGIITGAATALAPGGLLVFYGPFQEDGQHTGEGNARFDKRLRADNPAWGLRDITALENRAQACHLSRKALVPMPANNRLLIFEKPNTPA